MNVEGFAKSQQHQHNTYKNSDSVFKIKIICRLCSNCSTTCSTYDSKKKLQKHVKKDHTDSIYRDIFWEMIQ